MTVTCIFPGCPVRVHSAGNIVSAVPQYAYWRSSRETGQINQLQLNNCSYLQHRVGLGESMPDWAGGCDLPPLPILPQLKVVE